MNISNTTITPKEKAEQLVKSFSGWTASVTASMTIRSAKACAKIHVSELLKFFNDNMYVGMIDMDAVMLNADIVQYYKNVVDEIEKIK